VFRRIWTLIIKEVLAVWSDKKSRFLLIVPGILQLFIFAWAATLDITNVTIGILNRDSGEKAFELVQRFHGSPIFTKIIYLNNIDEITSFIDNQMGLMVVHIDDQFSRNLDAKKPAFFQIALDGRKTNSTQILLGYANSIVEQLNNDYASQINIKSPQLIHRSWFNPNLLYYWYNVPCLCGILSMVISLMVTALSIARERELGTFDQLLVSPMLPFEILIGKAIPAIIIGIAEGSIIIFASYFIFEIPLVGSLIYLYLSMLVFVSAIVGIGLFISSLCSTQQQAILGAYFFMSPSILLSGFATPIENMPIWLQYFTHLIPLRYFLVIAKGIFLKGIPFSVVFNNTWPMAIIACFTLSAAAWLFRRRME
jgi:ABC-2 type transport system permease protein